MIRIHNMRDSEPEPGNARHVYIGRRGRLPASPLANPYRIGVHGERAEVVTKYRAWLPNDPPALAEVARLAELARTGVVEVLAPSGSSRRLGFTEDVGDNWRRFVAALAELTGELPA